MSLMLLWCYTIYEIVIDSQYVTILIVCSTIR